jgi:hypothetical protein
VLEDGVEIADTTIWQMPALWVGRTIVHTMSDVSATAEEEPVDSVNDQIQSESELINFQQNKAAPEQITASIVSIRDIRSRVQNGEEVEVVITDAEGTQPVKLLLTGASTEHERIYDGYLITSKGSIPVHVSIPTLFAEVAFIGQQQQNLEQQSQAQAGGTDSGDGS